MIADDLIARSTVAVDGLLAGVFLGSCMMEHAARQLPIQHWIPYNRAKDAVYGPIMPVFFSATLLLSAGTTWRIQAVGQGIATSLLAVAGVITVRVNLPLNAEFRRWSCSDHPAAWDAARQRWRNWNLTRGVLVVAAFLVSLVG